MLHNSLFILFKSRLCSHVTWVNPSWAVAQMQSRGKADVY